MAGESWNDTEYAARQGEVTEDMRDDEVPAAVNDTEHAVLQDEGIAEFQAYQNIVDSLESDYGQEFGREQLEAVGQKILDEGIEDQVDDILLAPGEDGTIEVHGLEEYYVVDPEYFD